MRYEHTNETYRGHSLKIIQDEDAQSPRYWGNIDVFLCGWHSREFWVPPPTMEVKGQRGDPRDWIRKFKATHWTYPLEAYIHSGIVLALDSCGNFPDRRWDVSRNMGAVFLSKKCWKTRDSKKALAVAKSLVEEWNMYLSGDVWRYEVEHEPSEWEESCWGCYGSEYCEQEAKGAIDHHVTQLHRERIERVKSWVRNRVPLQVRWSVASEWDERVV